jgi:diguanylate cyclase (GGDEF)-like protein
LLAGFALLFALGLTVAAVVAVLLARRDRRLRDQMEQVHQLATTDPLTGLANRTQLVSALDTTLTLVDRGTLTGLAVVYLDLDGVKALNDRHGHDTTDRIFVAIAGALRASVRPADIIARIGGDEFIVLSPGVADTAQAALLADRLCSTIRGTEVPGADGAPTRLTASAGVAVTTIDQPPSSAVDLLRHADEAMYRVKNRGGNAAELARGIPIPRSSVSTGSPSA